MLTAAETPKRVRKRTLPRARRMLFEKDCFYAVVSGLRRRTDETLFSEVGKQLLENNLLCDFWHEREVENRP